MSAHRVSSHRDPDSSPCGESAGSSSPDRPGRLGVFWYVVADKADLYRKVIEVFATAKLRYRLQLRVEEVGRALRRHPALHACDEEELTRALDQLTSWGNLKRTQDTRDVATLEEFYRRRSLYQLTPEGEEAHKGVLAVENVFSSSGGRLSSVMLPSIAERLEAMKTEFVGPSPDAARLYGLLQELHGYSTELAENARRFMNDLADSLADLTLTDEAFLAYKKAVLVYLQSFIAALNRFHPRIAASLEELDGLGAARMLALAATADRAPTPDGESRGPVRELAARWEALRSWFVGSRHGPAEVEHLRDAATDAIARILRVLEQLNERRFLRVNRRADFLRLARWFAACPTPEASHELFTVAFGLHSARHFAQPCEDEELERGRSWWEAPSVHVPARLRRYGRRLNPGRSGRIADHSRRKKEALEALRRRDARVRAAIDKLAGPPRRLSDLGRLDRSEFEVLLDLLDAALRSAPREDGSYRARTASGDYTVTLSPPSGGIEAVIETDGGRLRAPDYLLGVSAREGMLREGLRRVS